MSEKFKKNTKVSCPNKVQNNSYKAHDTYNNPERVSMIVGNQAYADFSRASIIQREEITEEMPQTNYYIQTESDANGGISEVVKRSYDAHEGGKSDEPGFLKFKSPVKALDFTDVFLTETQVGDSWVYRKKIIDVKLPVSCIEAATWAMKSIRTDREIPYPGYLEFDESFYLLMTEVDNEWVHLMPVEDESGRINIDIINEAMEKIYRIFSKYHTSIQEYIQTRLEFNARTTGTRISSEPPVSMDRDMITNKLVRETEEYTGNYEVGDGILIAELSSDNENDSAEFHAAAITAEFPDHSFIVLERNAGTTEIRTGHLGDRNWVFNYYQNATDFKQKTQDDSTNFKAFRLIV